MGKYETERTQEHVRERERETKSAKGIEWMQRRIRSPKRTGGENTLYSRTRTNTCSRDSFRGGDVQERIISREGEERRWKEEALERERFKPRDRVVLNTIRRKAQAKAINRERSDIL